MRRCVWVYFRANAKYDKTLYIKIKRFLTDKSIYIWNLLVKSFPAIGRMMRKVDCNESYILIFFGIVKFDLSISSEPKQQKTGTKKDFEPTLKKNQVMHLTKVQIIVDNTHTKVSLLVNENLYDNC